MSPDNAGYYHAAYIATAIVYLAYGASIWWRSRALSRGEREARHS